VKQLDLFQEELDVIYRPDMCFDMSDVPISTFEPINIYSKWLRDRCDFLRTFPKDTYYIHRGNDIPYVLNKHTGTKYSIQTTRDKYPSIRLEKKTLHIHALVGIYFIENINPNITSVLDHVDGDKSNYSIKNLQWISQSDNQKRRSK
jgi:hypothetical protein